MTWVAWRQFRTQALVAALALIAAAIAVVIPGVHLHDLYDASGLARCVPHGDCRQSLVDDLANSSQQLRNLAPPALLILPALLGMFWGAPLLARELENGTQRLAWTQSVSRRRWLATRAALVGLATIAVCGLVSLLVSWALRPVDLASANRFNPGIFDSRGIVAIGYGAFAFGLGLAAGALLRRTLAAMALTFAGFVTARILFTILVRPHLLAASQSLLRLSQAQNDGFLASPSGVTVVAAAPDLPNAWAITAKLVNLAGRAPSQAQLHDLVARYCPGIAAGPGSNGGRGPAGGLFAPCLQRLSGHLRLLVTYQPASHYWPLQWLELAIYLAAGLALVVATTWLVGRRPTPRG